MWDSMAGIWEIRDGWQPYLQRVETHCRSRRLLVDGVTVDWVVAGSRRRLSIVVEADIGRQQSERHGGDGDGPVDRGARARLRDETAAGPRPAVYYPLRRRQPHRPTPHTTRLNTHTTPA